MRIEACILAVAVAVAIPAQGGQAQGGQAPGRQSPAATTTAIDVDKVIATVNDSAILLSSVRGSAAGKINAIEAQIGKRLQPREEQMVLKSYLEDEISRTSLAQAAMSFGVAPPEQIEKLLQDELERDEAEQVRDFGTYLKWSQEMAKQNPTWPTYQRQKRIDKLYEFAKSFAIGMRMQKQGNLYLTPQMLRETYRKNRSQFVHGATADVAIVLFTGPDAEQHARAASTQWAVENLTPRELAARVAGAQATPLPPLKGITEASRQSLDDAVVDFAIRGPADRVSGPLPSPAGFQVARIVNFEAAQDGRFEDAGVQQRLRTMCEKSVVEEFYKQALERAADRTEVWRSNEFR